MGNGWATKFSEIVIKKKSREMIKSIYPKKADWDRLLERPTQSFSQLEPLVEGIFNEVREQGDAAVKKYTDRFDSVRLDRIMVEAEEIRKATLSVPQNLREAILLAKGNIKKFHAAQRTSKVETQPLPGILCWQEKRPIQKVGLYIPGGTAPLFSTVLMLAVPAQLAGCPEIILCTPPNSQGKIDPTILYTAQLCGLTQIFKVGGIQAIAGMTFGTQSIPKVYKVFGPGNQYVTVAKQLATRYGLAIDMPAGPSELLVVADDTADPAFVASDLLSQAEHGADSQVILLTTSRELMALVESELARQMVALPRTALVERSMANSKLILVEDHGTALEMVDRYAPEHLILCVEDTQYYVDRVQNAGSVFIGNFTPESAGDYASGTNHTLPTSGYAKQYSGVNLDSFLKSMTFQKIDQEGIAAIGPAIEAMAEAEGLQAHKNAVTLRLNRIKETP